MEQLEYPPLGPTPYVSAEFSAYLAQAVAQGAHAQRLGNEGEPVVSRKAPAKAWPCGWHGSPEQNLQCDTTQNATPPKGENGAWARKNLFTPAYRVWSSP